MEYKAKIKKMFRRGEITTGKALAILTLGIAMFLTPIIPLIHSIESKPNNELNTIGRLKHENDSSKLKLKEGTEFKIDSISLNKIDSANR